MTTATVCLGLGLSLGGALMWAYLQVAAWKRAYDARTREHLGYVLGDQLARALDSAKGIDITSARPASTLQYVGARQTDAKEARP